MSKHILVSPQPDTLQRWQAAFPDALTFDHLADAAEHVLADDVLWLHIPPEARDADRLVQLASQRLPNARLVALADIPDDEQALALMERGALGYCHSHAGEQMLKQVATVVENQGLWVGPTLLQRMIKASGTKVDELSSPAPNDADMLSPREQDVARRVADGLSNKEIAREMDITERTVKAHISSIFMKWRVRDRLHLALKWRGESQ